MLSAEQAVAQVTKYWDWYGTGDIDAIAEILAPDVKRIGPHDGDEGDQTEGRDEYTSFMANARKMMPSGGTRSLEGVATADGRRVFFHGIEIVPLSPAGDDNVEVNVVLICDLNDDGLITQVDIFWKQPPARLEEWTQLERLNAAAELS